MKFLVHMVSVAAAYLAMACSTNDASAPKDIGSNPPQGLYLDGTIDQEHLPAVSSDLQIALDTANGSPVCYRFLHVDGVFAGSVLYSCDQFVEGRLHQDAALSFALRVQGAVGTDPNGNSVLFHYVVLFANRGSESVDIGISNLEPADTVYFGLTQLCNDRFASACDLNFFEKKPYLTLKDGNGAGDGRNELSYAR